MGLAQIDFDTLVDAFVLDENDGVTLLLSEIVDGKPRVTKSSIIINAVVDFLKKTTEI